MCVCEGAMRIGRWLWFRDIQSGVWRQYAAYKVSSKPKKIKIALLKMKLGLDS